MKNIIQVILIFTLCSCSNKVIINDHYLNTKKELSKYILGLNTPATKDSQKSKPQESHLRLKAPTISRQISNSKHKTRWYINDGNPYNKSDALFPKFTFISIKSKGMTKTKIKISSYQRGLIFKSRQYGQQAIWASQIENYFAKSVRRTQ